MVTTAMGDPSSLVPPLRFTTVCPRVYRGAYPRKINYAFLKRYKVKTIISLTPNAINEETDESLFYHAQKEGIQLLHVEVGKGGKGKKRAVPLTHEKALNVIQMMIDQENLPVYIHCLNGGHVTSLVVACLRSVLVWNNASIVNEFLLFSETINVADRSFVESFSGELKLPKNYADIWQGIETSNPNIRLVSYKDHVTLV